MLTLASAVVIMVFSAQEARELLSPMYHLAKNIRVPHVLDRLEVAVLSAWIGVLCLKIALFLHAASRALADLFGLRRHEPFIFPLAAVNLALAQTLFAEEPSVRARVAVVLPIVAVILILTPVLAALITKAETKGDTRYAK
jgi:multisubunit Na+/H+ antiporter MnhG subunit